MSKLDDAKQKGKSAAMAKPGSSVPVPRGGGGSSALDAAIKRLQAKGFEAAAENAEVVEQQGNVVDDKDRLVGIDFLIIDIKRKVSERFGSPFCIFKAMLPSTDIVIVTDGSTGIMDELEGKAPTPDAPLLVKGGLRKSTYDRKKKNPDWRRGDDPEEKYLRNPETGDFLYEEDERGNRLKGTTYHLSGESDLSQVRGLAPKGSTVNGGRQLRA